MKKLRMTIDIAMTVVFIGLMAYSLIGELTHEILGTVMIVLFVVHHILNRRWFGALLKGKYRAFRIFQTVLVLIMIVSVLASAINKNGGGQLLICIYGKGWYQEWGKEARELYPGDVVNIPANVKHWHGAAKDSWFQHIAQEISGESTGTEWCEPVDDEQYNKLK